MRFADPAEEREYQRWRVSAQLPYLQLGILGAAAIWLNGTALLWLWSRAAFAQVGGYLAAIVLLFIGGALLAVNARTRRYSPWIGLTLNLVAGTAVSPMFALLWHSPGGAVVGVVFVQLFGLFMRFKPLQAALIVVPTTAVSLTLTAQAWAGRVLNDVDSFLYFLMPVMSLGAVLAASHMLERLSREAFAAQLTIGRQRALIRRYVPPAVAARIEAGEEHAIDAPRRVTVTVLFADIVGFTAMAERLPPALLTRVLREYTGEMSRLVGENRGTLNEFAGDGVMAIFGAPEELAPPLQVRSAVAVARAMQGSLVSMNRAWLESGLPSPVAIRVGINTGELSVGSFGSHGRMTYTAIGLQTNIASRIQGLCEPGGILLSDASWQLVKDEIPCEPRGEAQVKGVHFPVSLYAPIRG